MVDPLGLARGGVLHDDDDNADVTPSGRPDFVALGLKTGPAIRHFDLMFSKRQHQGRSVVFLSDNAGGAACCTGDGDALLRFCPSFLAVEMMRQGATPERACRETVTRVCHGLGTHQLEMGIIAMNTQVPWSR